MQVLIKLPVQASIISEASRHLCRRIRIGTDAEGKPAGIIDTDNRDFMIRRDISERAAAPYVRVGYQLTNPGFAHQRAIAYNLDTARYVADRSFRVVGYDGHPDLSRCRVSCGP